MLEVVAEEYRLRVPQGYPIVVDLPEQGTLGIELEPGHALHIISVGDQLYAQTYYRSTRYDARSSASREKFAGSPVDDRRPISPSISDQGLRNLIAELCSRFNSQQLLIHITDT
jgi:hypothetical protein